MRSTPVVKAFFAAGGLLLLATLAIAQTASAPAADLGRDEPVLDRRTQRVEHIQIEDAGNRVDEVRVGGETKRITVQPKVGVPAYEVQPTDATGTHADSREASPGSAGRRVWKLHQF